MKTEQIIHICKLQEPADCNDRKELCFMPFAICEGNSLYDTVANCSYRKYFIGRESTECLPSVG